MKKAAAVILILTALSGCGGGTPAVEMISSRPFEAKAQLIWKEKSYEGAVIRQSADELTMSFTGENLTFPVCYEIAQGGYRVTQGDLELSLPYEQAPPGAVAVVVYEALKAMPAAEVSQRDGVAVYELPTAVFRYDTENDRLISLSMRDGEMSFTDFVFTEEEK